eukprot:TRINITY_DN2609_c0_g2_i1.p1 TRINITY_DN2609_c0_g2~~TRINITY_DN2609_c0_g2_i1.p1  ORF type:complete len:129 (+),score=24.61 TRINITY_DN2609_c0_g2_i1:28-387(+)
MSKIPLKSLVKVHIADGFIIGRLLSVDSKYMNTILNEAAETRTYRNGTSKERYLGLIIIRGENIQHIAVLAPPPTISRKRVHKSDDSRLRTSSNLMTISSIDQLTDPNPSMKPPPGLPL